MVVSRVEFDRVVLVLVYKSIVCWVEYVLQEACWLATWQPFVVLESPAACRPVVPLSPQAATIRVRCRCTP